MNLKLDENIPIVYRYICHLSIICFSSVNFNKWHIYNLLCNMMLKLYDLSVGTNFFVMALLKKRRESSSRLFLFRSNF